LTAAPDLAVADDAAFTPVHTAYDRYVAVMRVTLGLGAAVLAALLFLWPLMRDEERSFVLNEERMRPAGETIRIVGPVYRGTDARDRLFTVAAEQAVQSSADDPLVALEGIAARMELGESRFATATAEDGVYDTDDEILSVPGPMMLETSDGYRLNAQAARVDLADKIVSSDQPVEGLGPLGRIEAQSFTIDIDGRKAVFEGNVRMRTTPAGRE